MAVHSPSQRVLEQLVPIMEERGFAYRKKGHSFLRTIGPANQEFHVDFDGRGGLVSVGGGFSVRFVKFEALTNKALGCKLGAAAVAGFLQMGIDPYKYDIFADDYADLTPKQKGAIDPELVHPQARVDEAVRYVVGNYEQYVAPVFDRLTSYRELADYLKAGRGTNGWTPERQHPSSEIPMALLLAASLQDDPTDILAYAEQVAPTYTGRDVAGQIARIQHFVSQASPEDLLLD